MDSLIGVSEDPSQEIHWGQDLAGSGAQYGLEQVERVVTRKPLVAMTDYWKSIRKDRWAPEREDFDPLDIGPILQHVFLVDVLAEGGFYYRVVGTAIVGHVGFDASRKMLSDLSDKVDVGRIAGDFTDFVEAGVPRYDYAQGPWHGLPWRVYHRLLLPLGPSEGDVRQILGCIDLETGTKERLQ